MTFKHFLSFVFIFSFGIVWSQNHKNATETQKGDLNKQQTLQDTTLLKHKDYILPKDSLIHSKDSLKKNSASLPEFLTKKYSFYDPSKIVTTEQGQRISTKEDARIQTKPFDGLQTSGSISRGITVGNNQNAVTNSNLDLQISGQLSDGINIRASLQDSSIPIQDGGYSQKLDEFDQIFMELYAKNWNVRAGDLFLENKNTRFLNFSKKVQGLAASIQLNNGTSLYGSAALVRGNYSKTSFVGQEGNQGPYKLKGSMNELYVLVISGSERVYVNGVLKTRGEANDYIIDYNAGEVRFTPKFPITSEMRIVVEYQYSERNYSRFVTYDGVKHEKKSWHLGAYLYAENDIKNQPLQQNLSEEQVKVLQNAGNNPQLMYAPSAYIDTYAENKILYEKKGILGLEYFEFSRDENQTLYHVTFTYAGANQGDYKLSNAQTVEKIYQYVSPIDGIPQGDYIPYTKLVPPTKLQVATVVGGYHPNEKTEVNFEIGISNNDQNLFSTIDDRENKGIAVQLDVRQQVLDKQWKINLEGHYNFLESSFKTVERIYGIEFERDWNTGITSGNQSLIKGGIQAILPQKALVNYQIEKLDYSSNFSGNRHLLDGRWDSKNMHITTNNSVMNSKSQWNTSKFIRSSTTGLYEFGKNWVGGSFNMEDNQETVLETQKLTGLSQRFSEYGVKIGRGNKDGIFGELGYLHRVNDSLRNGMLTRVNHSNAFYINSKIIQNDRSDLSVYANYRVLDKEGEAAKEPSLNSRVSYSTQFWNQLLQSATVYETSSGTLAQQEFTYLEVEPGQGAFMWIDYNANGLQELEEFEVALFPDQAKYVRVFLPNQVYLKTHQNRFSQSLTWNPSVWMNDTGFKKFWSKFHNQTSVTLDRKVLKEGNDIDLNPFFGTSDQVVGLNSSWRNSLYFNRGIQRYSNTYTFLSNASKNLLSIGSQEMRSTAHQYQFSHLIYKTWLLGLNANSIAVETISENYASKNYKIKGGQGGPSFGIIFNNNASWNFNYNYKQVENLWTGKEQLKQRKLSTTFNYASVAKFTVNGELAFLKNQFTGNSFSAASYQMMEGLQDGNNMTWRLLLQKNLTQYLDININYQGRKSEETQMIHTGNVQLRAFF